MLCQVEERWQGSLLHGGLREVEGVLDGWVVEVGFCLDGDVWCVEEVVWERG
jgi:hypothetical protein